MSKEDPIKKFLDFIGKNLNKQNHEDKKGGKKNSKIYNFIVAALILVLAGIVIVITSDMTNPSKAVMKTYDTGGVIQSSANEEEIETSVEDYGDELKKELVTLLEKIDGVGKVDLMIYFESGKEQIPAINVNDSESVTNENDNNGGTRKINSNNDGRTVVMMSDGTSTKPLITKTKEPEINGITVVAEGASDKLIRMRISQAVTTLFDLDSKKVQVYPMKRE